MTSREQKNTYQETIRLLEAHKKSIAQMRADLKNMNLLESEIIEKLKPLTSQYQKLLKEKRTHEERRKKPR